MIINRWSALTAVLLTIAIGAPALAEPIYLWADTGVTVALGSNTTPGSWNNTANGYDSIDDALIKVIDAPSATATEVHTQATHIWYTTIAGGGLELLFDFQTEYDIDTLHIWNYNGGDGFDVDSIAFTFFNATNTLQGSLAIDPLPPGVGASIVAQDVPLAAPLNVRYVTAFLGTTNGQIDFQNIGFTAELSTPVDPPPPPPPPVPEPGSLALLGTGVLALFAARRRRAAV